MGPGSYASPDELDHMQKIKKALRHNLPQDVFFGKQEPRDRFSYLNQESSARAFQGSPSQYHSEASMVKKTFNHYLMSGSASKENLAK